MDGAGWHTEEIANDFKCQCHQTSTLFPKLNPIGQVWRWLRQRDLANQSFTDYDDITSKVCDA
ncbi:TPA: hypothetical protein NJ487_004600 [Vibrio parahaemolyticus]|nr:hypothetical protein [Vibrio parahaemolyticus]